MGAVLFLAKKQIILAVDNCALCTCGIPGKETNYVDNVSSKVFVCGMWCKYCGTVGKETNYVSS